jgi:murein DD-endopeptidase MepM/ murein hydrolase activator NlpD
MKSAVALAIVVASLVACDQLSDRQRKEDTTTAPAAAGGSIDSAAGAIDSLPGVPAVPRDSGEPGAPDTGSVQIHPSNPRRGGVVFAHAEGVATTIPRCAWKGATVPCYAHGTGVLAILPLPADEPAGTFTLVVERAGGRLTRQITVSDRPFERELIFLDSAKYALVRRGQDIARDARALRAALGTESPERLWSGAWRAPVTGGRSSGYGADRLYYRASDSSRAVTIGSDARVRGQFGVDTSVTAAKDAPGWRHSGIDIAVGKGTTVAAPAAGTVTEVGEYTLTGRTLILDHGRGVHTAYFHLDTILVRKGDVVRQRRAIARVGETGLATGPHLHYGVYIHGKDVDPDAWAEMPRFMLEAPADSARRGRTP